MHPGASAAPPDRLEELRGSAKGWHGIQLAALGFIGLCGVIQTGDSSNPWALQVLSGILVLVAFCLACAGIYLVGRAAWPLYRGEEPAAAADDEAAAIELTSRQLTRGLLMTFLSIAALALATTASWWPQDESGGAGASTVQVQTDDGRTACGQLTGSPQPGTLRVVADARPVVLSLDAIAVVAPVERC